MNEGIPIEEGAPDVSEEAPEKKVDPEWLWKRTIQAQGVVLPEEVLNQVWKGQGITMSLSRPVEYAGKTYTEIHVRPLKPSYMRTLSVDSSKWSFGVIFGLSAKLIGQPDMMLDELSTQDLGLLTGITTAFISLLQPTGAPQ